MSDGNNLWTMFQNEAMQHIDDADSAVYQVVSMQAYEEKDILGKIYRAFHSIKGLARALDLSGLEEITHECEDFLNFATNNPHTFNTEKAHLLGEVIAKIQSLSEEICYKKMNISPSNDFKELVKKLKASVKAGKDVETIVQEVSPEPVVHDDGIMAFFLELVADYLKESEAESTKQFLMNAATSLKFEECKIFLNDMILKTPDDYLQLLDLLLFNNQKAIAVQHFTNVVEFVLYHILNEVKKQFTSHPLPDFMVHIKEKVKAFLPSDDKVQEYLNADLTVENLLDIRSNSLMKKTEALIEHLKNKTSSKSVQPEKSVLLEKNPDLKPVPVDVEKSIRVSGSTLENFMDNIGEIVLNNARLNHFLADKDYKNLLNEIQFLMKNRKGSEDDILIEKLKNLIEQVDVKNQNLNDNIHSLNSSLSTLHDTALNLRVVPMELIYRKLPRTVKLIAEELKKEVNLVLEGHDVQIDKIMVDTLSDPIIHILRNAVDHGLESDEERLQLNKPRAGTITIKTEQQGSRIQLQIMDDGHGINREKIIKKVVEMGLLPHAEVSAYPDEKLFNFIFHPGFSTASSVSNISGRGIGMDIVRMNVMQLGGTIHIASQPHKGTIFTIKVPITAAIQDVLIVSSDQQKIAIPNSYVNEVLQINAEDVMTIKNSPACLLRNQYLPILNLSYALGFSDKNKSKNQLHTIVVISRMDAMIGIEVDRVLEKTQVFMKEIDSSITTLMGVGGVTIRGNGEVMIILDCEDIFEQH